MLRINPYMCELLAVRCMRRLSSRPPTTRKLRWRLSVGLHERLYSLVRRVR